MCSGVGFFGELMDELFSYLAPTMCQAFSGQTITLKVLILYNHKDLIKKKKISPNFVILRCLAWYVIEFILHCRGPGHQDLQRVSHSHTTRSLQASDLSAFLYF